MVPQPEKTRINVLVVDDDPVTRQILSDLLTGRDCRVATATNGEDAIQLALVYRPDLIFLDVIMPHLDGFQTLERLRKMEKTRAIPVIIITSRTDSATLMQALRMGANDFITKPFLRGDLIRKMNFVLLNRQQQNKFTEAALAPDPLAAPPGKSYERMRESFILHFENIYLTLLRLISERNQKELERVIARLLDTVQFYQFMGVEEEIAQLLRAVSEREWDRAVDYLENAYHLFRDFRTTIPRVLQ
ncbi:MAG: response regulator [Calditrichaceae bacterium]|nr:response regulator [Calditrichia bacterium]NUQ40154.1 response regulator [Calditrichaceae bacterium]